MRANESQEPKSNDDLQQLWQQSIHNESIKLKKEKMIHDINKQIKLIDFMLPSGRWSVSLFMIFMAVRGIVKLLKGIDIGDEDKIIFGVADFICFSALAIRSIIVDIKTSHFNENNERDYCRKQLARIKLQIFYVQYLSPFLLVICSIALVLSMVLDFQLWKAALVGFGIFTFMFVIYFDRDQLQNKLLPLRDKLESALQHLNEKV